MCLWVKQIHIASGQVLLKNLAVLPFFFFFLSFQKGGPESSCARWVLLSVTVEWFTFHRSGVYPLCSHEFVLLYIVAVLGRCHETVIAKVRGLSMLPCCCTVASCDMEMFSAPLKSVTLYMKGWHEEWHDTTVTMIPDMSKETECSWLWSLNVIHSVMPLHLCGKQPDINQDNANIYMPSKPNHQT